MRHRGHPHTDASREGLKCLELQCAVLPRRSAPLSIAVRTASAPLPPPGGGGCNFAGWPSALSVRPFGCTLALKNYVFLVGLSSPTREVFGYSWTSSPFLTRSSNRWDIYHRRNNVLEYKRDYVFNNFSKV